MDWLWKGLFTTTLGRVLWILGGIVVASVLAWLKKRGHSVWTDTVRYALGVFALIIFSLLGVRLFIASPPEQITADNVQTHVRDWLLGFGMQIRERTDHVHFLYDVTLRDRNP